MRKIYEKPDVEFVSLTSEEAIALEEEFEGSISLSGGLEENIFD